MKTETEGLSRERFEKWFSEEHPQHSLEWQSGGGHYRYAFTEELWRTAQHFYADSPWDFLCESCKSRMPKRADITEHPEGLAEAQAWKASQATKEEWARRIAEFVASKYAGGRWYEEVLARMTNEP